MQQGAGPVTPLSSVPGHSLRTACPVAAVRWTLDVLASPARQAENAWKLTGAEPALAPQGGAPVLPTVASQRGFRRHKNFLPELPVVLVRRLTARGPVRLDMSELMGAPALQSWPLPESLLLVPAGIRLPLPATPTPAPPGHLHPPTAAPRCTVPVLLLGVPCRAPLQATAPGEQGAAVPILKSREQRLVKMQDRVSEAGRSWAVHSGTRTPGLCPGDSPDSRPLPCLCVCLSALTLCGFSELLPQGLNHAQCCRLEMGWGSY